MLSFICYKLYKRQRETTIQYTYSFVFRRNAFMITKNHYLICFYIRYLTEISIYILVTILDITDCSIVIISKKKNIHYLLYSKKKLKRLIKTKKNGQ